ncbi:DUF3080 domain-containing protein [Vibrio mediterranei]|uniref:DUF3080 family protein n=1 Tax=Vibrio mediterranei TaxID=689 RepID=UPI001EFE4079|nr:DUF3080 family protein [Vibrio mediterranei]MCG9661496.1 DUF3080 domain-containing protein [Vibrio mediterranei]
MKALTIPPSSKVILAFVFIISALTGCLEQKGAESRFEDYLSRIASVQDSDALPSPDNALITLPSQREITIDIPRTTLGIVDSYQLRKCHLFELIAERNSVLGKVQDQFRDFDYQIALIDGIERCLLSDKIEQSVKAQLEDILATKYRYLPSYFSNLIFTSHAMRAQLSGNQWLDEGISSQAAQLHSALNTFNSIADYILTQTEGSHTLTLPPSITPYQETLEKTKLIGNLAYSLQASTQWLTVATQQLQKYDNKILCGANRDTTRFNYLVNIFNNLFITDIQPYLSFLSSEYQAISREVVFIKHVLDKVQQDKVSVYRLDRIYDEFKTANQQHVFYWKSLFKRCGKTLTEIRQP